MITPERVIELLNRTDDNIIYLFTKTGAIQVNGIHKMHNEWFIDLDNNISLNDLSESPPKPKTALDDLDDCLKAKSWHHFIVLFRKKYESQLSEIPAKELPK